MWLHTFSGRSVHTETEMWVSLEQLLSNSVSNSNWAQVNLSRFGQVIISRRSVLVGIWQRWVNFLETCQILTLNKVIGHEWLNLLKLSWTPTPICARQHVSWGEKNCFSQHLFWLVTVKFHNLIQILDLFEARSDTKLWKRLEILLPTKATLVSNYLFFSF